MARLRKEGRPWLRGTGASRRRAGTISATPADAPMAIRRARRRHADSSRSSLWSIGADGSDLRRLLDTIDWADLQPQGRPS